MGRMKFDKKIRTSGKHESYNSSTYRKKKQIKHYDQELVEIVTSLRESVKNYNIDKMYEALEDINYKELTMSDIEYLLELKFPDIIQDCLEYLANKISPCNRKVNKDEDGNDFGVIEVKVLKFILNILLDVSEFHDYSQIINSEFGALKLKFLFECGIGGNLLLAVENIEELYLCNSDVESSFTQIHGSGVGCEFMHHEVEMLYESALVTYFQLLESTIEIDPLRVSKKLMELEGLFEWLVKALDDGNRSIVDEISSLKVEILSIMFQFVRLSEVNIESRPINKRNLIDKFLIVMANFGLRDSEIGGVKEKEFVYNVVDIVCNFMFETDLRNEFSSLQGLELMIKFMKDDSFMKVLSIKIISFALIEEGEMNNNFIKLDGVRLVFALLAHSSKCIIIDKHYRKTRRQQDTDEHLCSIIKSLLRFCTGNYHETLINTLKEDKHLRLKYFLVLRKYYSHKINQALEKVDDFGEGDQMDIIETLAMDAGLFIVQLIDLITVYTIYYEKENVKKFESDVLMSYEVKLVDLRKSIEDFTGSMDDDEMTFNNKMLKFLKS